jgi:hypothetical protein
MKSFKQYISEQQEGTHLFRYDTQELSSKTKGFDFDNEYNSSSEGKMTGKITNRKGLFAAPIHEAVPYVAGRKTPFIFAIPVGSERGTVYFENRHKKHIESQRPIEHQFHSSQGFKQIPTGEYFAETETTPTPRSKRVVTNPLELIGQHHEIKWVDSLEPVKKKYADLGDEKMNVTINGD